MSPFSGDPVTLSAIHRQSSRVTEVAAVPRGIGQNVLAALRRNPLGRRHRVGVLDGR